MNTKSISYKLFNISFNLVKSIKLIISEFAISCILNITLSIALLNYIFQYDTNYLISILVAFNIFFSLYRLLFEIRNLYKEAKFIENSIIVVKELGCINEDKNNNL